MCRAQSIYVQDFVEEMGAHFYPQSAFFAQCAEIFTALVVGKEGCKRSETEFNSLKKVREILGC